MTEDDQSAADAEELAELHERAIIWDRVRAAFSWRVRPVGRLTDVCSPIAHDVSGTLSGKAWWEVGPRELQRIRIDINTLRPDAFWYYFRSFAYDSLVVEGTSDDVGGWMVSALRPPGQRPSSGFDAKVAALTEEERRCVRHFVDWYVGQNTLTAPDALLAFWARPEGLTTDARERSGESEAEAGGAVV
ncbi:hypothetical protein GCM10023205_31840 [Yinghuangia aomiensis]|uniref:Uncharacterized protein n=1 Tax=Yinghuangia aomiensis TaxID=676205 RepID=A0ABP9H9Y4_9ACTN